MYSHNEDNSRKIQKKTLNELIKDDICSEQINIQLYATTH